MASHHTGHVVGSHLASATAALAAVVAARLPSDRRPPIPIWITYEAIHDREGVDAIVADLRDRFGLTVQPILTP
ncbi:MAG: hypothetical protein U0Q47_10330 [Mycobacterium sp.]